MNVIGWAVNLLGSSTQQSVSVPTGAIDVVAIKRSDGGIVCSPFHVRMNKAKKKGEKRLVKIRVNGKDVNVNMKLGYAGWHRFYFTWQTFVLTMKSK
jgi:phosphatidate phosphatase PAH1